MSHTLLSKRAAMLAQSGLERQLRTVTSAIGPEVQTADGLKLLFCSNDYLGFAGDQSLRQRLADAALDLGAGSAGSRLVCGNTGAHDELEQELAAFFGSGRAVLFPSGYQANLGALGALTQAGDVIFSDELCHASIIDGCRLSRARVEVFPHGDVDTLDRLMRDAADPGLRLVVTDSVFSMDGDIAPLRALFEACERHGGLLYIDEAHSFGVIGPAGRGVAADVGLPASSVLRVGTLGKSLGLSGAFLLCGEDEARLVRSCGRSQMYSTAAPPALVQAARTALRLSAAADDRREVLRRNIELWRGLASEAGLPLIASTTPIQPVMVGDARKVMAVSESLWRSGVFVQGIRPPTVPVGTARLRITLTATHEPRHIERLVRELRVALLS